MNCIACGRELGHDARYCSQCGTPAGRGVSPGGAERRVVTVLFGDLSDFTAWAETLDPERVGRLTDRVLRVMAQVVVAFGGHVDKLTGDGIMAVFGAPVAHEDDAERAVRAAGAMQLGVREVLAEEIGAGQRLGLHVGLNTGEVVSGVQAQLAYTVVGDIVNTASRLADAAHAGDIYAGQATVDAVGPTVVWRRLPPLALKGKLAPVRAYQLESIREVAPHRGGPASGAMAEADAELQAQQRTEAALDGEPDTDSATTSGTEHARAAAAGLADSGVRVGYMAPFVDRATELQVLSDWFRDAVDGGEPSLCVVVGEAGVGKSRLVREFTRVIGDVPGTLVVRGHCPPYGAERDLVPLAELVRDLCGVGGETDRLEALQRVERTVGRLIQTHPEVTVTADLIPRLASMLGLAESDPGSPPGPVLTAAPGASPPGDVDAFDSLLRLATAGGPVVVVLDDAQWMTEGLIELALGLLRRVSGPLGFVLAVRPDLPEQISAAADRVLGTAIERVRWLGLMPLPDAAIDDLLQQSLNGPVDPAAADVVKERAAGNPFFLGEIVTLLVEQGVLSQEAGTWTLKGRTGSLLPSGVRAVLASRIDQLSPQGREVLRDASIVGSPIRLAALGALADGDSAGLRRGLQELLDRGLLRYAESETYVFANALIQEVVYAGIPKAERARQHVQLARFMAGGEREGGALGTTDDSLWLSDDSQPTQLPELLIATHADRAMVLADDLDLPPEEVLEPLRDVAAPAFAWLGSRALRRAMPAEALRNFDRVAVLTGGDYPPSVRLDRAWALASVGELVEAKREAGPLSEHEDPEIRSGAHLVLTSVARARGDLWVATAHANQALTIAQNASLSVEAGQALRQLGQLQFFSGQLAESETTFGEALALAEETPDTQGLGWTLQHLAWTKTMRGDFDEALDVLAWAESTFREVGFRAGLAWVEGTRAMIWLLQGRFRDAWILAGRLIGADAGEGDGDSEPSWAASGELPGGFAGRPVSGSGDRWGEAVLMAVRSIAGSALGRHRESARDAQRSLESMRLLNDLWGESFALVAQGQNLVVTGDYEQAEATLELALQRSVEGRAPFTGVLALGFLGYLNIREGKPEIAEARARRALDILRRTDVEQRSLIALEALLAIAVGHQGRADEAVEIMEPLVIATGEGTDAVLLPRARLLAHYAEVLLAAGRLEEARHWANAAITLPVVDAFSLVVAREVVASLPERGPESGEPAAGEGPDARGDEGPEGASDSAPEASPEELVAEPEEHSESPAVLRVGDDRSHSGAA